MQNTPEKEMQDILHDIKDAISNPSESENTQQKLGEDSQYLEETMEETQQDTEELLELSDKDIVENQPETSQDVAQDDAISPTEEPPAESEPPVSDILNSIDEEQQEETQAKESASNEFEDETDDNIATNADVNVSTNNKATDATDATDNSDSDDNHDRNNNIASNAPNISPGLINDDVKNASKSALDNFVKSIPRPQVEDMHFRGGTSLENLVIEAIKPMMANWLNENLPIIVEEVVRKEIRKILPEG